MTARASRFADRFPALVTTVTWVMRVVVGGLFLFSGFTKGVDLWGTVFKFREYFSVWGYEVWDALNLAGVTGLCVVEFLTGFFLLFGCMRRATPVIALVIMAFMLPLTLWLAVSNPISDCGCFGDAIKLTNWQTFYKNIIITAGAVWLLIYNRRAICLINPYLQWIAALAGGGFLLIVAWIGYFYQPLIDFRPYKTGTEIIDFDENAGEADETDALRFVYEKDGLRKEFTIDDELPDEEEGWTFVERYYAEPDGEVVVAQPDFAVKAAKNLRLYTEDGHEDVTEDVLGNGRQLILMIPVLSEVTAAKTWKINSFYEWCRENDIEMLAAVGGNPYEIRRWKDISLAEYPIYTSDDTAIEEVVRGNPGIVYLEDGIIKWKSSLKAINIDDFQKEDISNNPMSFARDDRRILATLIWIFAGVTLLLVFLSFSPKLLNKIINLSTRKKHKNHEDKNAG